MNRNAYALETKVCKAITETWAHLMPAGAHPNQVKGGGQGRGQAVCQPTQQRLRLHGAAGTGSWGSEPQLAAAPYGQLGRTAKGQGARSPQLPLQPGAAAWLCGLANRQAGTQPQVGPAWGVRKKGAAHWAWLSR